MNPKYVVALTDIQHLVVRAVLEDQDAFAENTFVEITEKINAALDGAAGVRALPGCPSLMPAKVIPHDEPAAEVPRNKAKDAAKRGVVRSVASPMTVVFQTKVNDDRVLSADINYESTVHRTEAYLYDGQNTVCKIDFFNQYQGRNWAYPIVRRALNGLMSKAGKSGRYRDNAKKEQA